MLVVVVVPSGGNDWMDETIGQSIVDTLLDAGLDADLKLVVTRHTPSSCRGLAHTYTYTSCVLWAGLQQQGDAGHQLFLDEPVEFCRLLTESVHYRRRRR